MARKKISHYLIRVTLVVVAAIAIGASASPIDPNVFISNASRNTARASDPEFAKWVRRFQNLVEVHAKISTVSTIETKLLVVDDGALNARVFPDKRLIVFHTGLLELIGEDQSALAAVMGHEFAHVERGHAAARNSAIQIIARRPLRHFQEYMAKTGDANVAWSQALKSELMSYAREQELDADDYGIQMASKAGYDPAGAKAVALAMLASGRGARESPLMATHPGWLERQMKNDVRVSDETFNQKAPKLLAEGNWVALNSMVTEWLALLPDSGNAWYFKAVLRRRMNRIDSVEAFENAFSRQAPSLNHVNSDFTDAWTSMCIGLFHEGHRLESLACSKSIRSEPQLQKYQRQTRQENVLVGGNEPRPLPLRFIRTPDGRKLITNDVAQSESTPEWKAIRFK